MNEIEWLACLGIREKKKTCTILRPRETIC
jgi:hypothetical protein